MNRLSLNNNRLKLKTAPIVWEEIYTIYPNLIKEIRRMWTCNRLDLQTLGSQPVMPKNEHKLPWPIYTRLDIWWIRRFLGGFPVRPGSRKQGGRRRTRRASQCFCKLVHLAVIKWKGFKVCGCYLVRLSCFSSSYRLDLHNKSRVVLSNLWWNICRNRIKNRTSPNIVMVIISVSLLISWLNI